MTDGTIMGLPDAALTSRFEAALQVGASATLQAISDEWSDLSRVELAALHKLVCRNGHRHRQFVVRAIQDLADPRSVSVLHDALVEGFDVYAYTASLSGVIAKWVSPALAAIGTSDAIETLKTFSRSSDPAIAQEMRCRLMRIGGTEED
jgi:hypothetical protein